MRLSFDRGTLILDSVPSGLPLAELPGLRWDGRVEAYRAPAHRYRDLLQALRRHGLVFVDEVTATGPRPDRWRPIELRPYQAAALDAWELAGGRGVVVLPTGAGKTRVALAAMARSGLRTLCLMPTRALLEQWREAIGRSYPGSVGCYGDGIHELRPVTVTTFESAFRYMDRIGSRFDLLVVDEAHHFASGERQEALEMAIAGRRLGLTATPVAGREAGLRRARLLGPVVYELGLGDLSGSFLAEVELVRMNLELSREERRSYEADMAELRPVYAEFRAGSPDGSWAEFSRFARLLPEGRKALEGWRRARRRLAYTDAKARALAALLARHRDGRVIVFTADNASAYAVARQHLVMPLTCDIGRGERRQALGRFRDGGLKALVSARVLNEGLDVPDAEVAIIVGGTSGGREHVQRIGRLLRVVPGKRATVYELITRGTLEVHQARRRRESLASRVTASA